MQIRSKMDTSVSTTQRFKEASSIPMGRESVRVFMFLFWPCSRPKKNYKSDERTFINFEKIDSSLYNLSGRYAFDIKNHGRNDNSREQYNPSFEASGVLNKSKKISYGTNSENRVLRPNIKFTRHNIVT